MSMNTKSMMNIMICLAVSLSLIACAATQITKIADGGWREYIVPLDNQSINAPLITLRVAAVRVESKDLQVSPDSRRAQEIHASLTNFGAAIAQELNHASSSASARQPLQIAISFDGTENLHLARAFTQGFFTGLFTFGLLGNVLPGVYTYQSKVSVDVSSNDGKKGAYAAESQDVTVKYDANDQNAIANAASTARRQADDESLQKIASQIAHQGFFQ